MSNNETEGQPGNRPVKPWPWMPTWLWNILQSLIKLFRR
jgi:hypothetical protein